MSQANLFCISDEPLGREHLSQCNFLKAYPNQGPCCCEALAYAAAVKAAASPKQDARRLPYTGPFPRKRHYHRCPKCRENGGGGVNCYKSKCSLPVLLSVPCSWCR